MRPRRLLWQIFPPIVLIVVLSLLAISTYTSRSLRAFHAEQKTTELAARAALVKTILESSLTLHDPGRVDDAVKRLGALTSTRITVVSADGEVLGDSSKPPAQMDDHSTRPEIRQAMQGARGSSVRFSETIGEDMLYVALPLRGPGDDTVTVVRTALPLTALAAALEALHRRMAGVGMVIAALAAVFTLVLSSRLSRPLEDLQRAAARFAGGDFSVRLPAQGSAEIAGVAEAMNRMASQLDDRIRAVIEQRNEREAVLAGMTEAVLAVNAGEAVTTLNSAAAELLGVDPGSALGRNVQEVARTPELQRFVATALHSRGPQEADLTLHGGTPRYLQAHGAPLRDSQGTRIGAVIVLNDVTRLRRLENIRSDFVANVSHELKTPITSIKGFIETLADGAVNDPPSAARFLEIAGRQADRLTAIIDDLLSLSRIEQESDDGTLPVAAERVIEILRGALDVCRSKAEAKQIGLDLDCDHSLEASVSAPLVEQAIVNLVDNAVKYSEEGSVVHIDASLEAEELVIRVRDHGCGIEPLHLPRLFERFYRVDKARSRVFGGTGLGLAIVKHIAQAHRGSVEVDSTAGRGTTFSLRLRVSADARTGAAS